MIRRGKGGKVIEVPPSRLIEYRVLGKISGRNYVGQVSGFFFKFDPEKSDAILQGEMDIPSKRKSE